VDFDIKDIDGIVKEVGTSQLSVIPILQAIQERFNYLPEEALRRVCEISEVTPGQIVGVASFYSQFRFTPAGQHMIKVCVGTACHVKGAEQVYDAMKRELDLGKDEDTTESGKYTIERVNCLGCCTLAPVVQIDETTYGHVTTTQVASILTDFESQKGDPGKKKYKYADSKEVKGEIRIGLGSCCVASGKGLVRIKIYDQSGKLLSVVAPPKLFKEEGKAPDICVDEEGIIYALDFDRELVRIFEPKGNG